MTFVLTRPFGATFGDFLTKPMSHGAIQFVKPRIEFFPRQGLAGLEEPVRDARGSVLA